MLLMADSRVDAFEMGAKRLKEGAGYIQRAHSRHSVPNSIPYAGNWERIGKFCGCYIVYNIA